MQVGRNYGRSIQRSFGLQRLFSTFPGGSPGLGLLLLRGAVGVTVAVDGSLSLAGATSPGVSAWVFGLLAIASGASLVAGFLTPGAGAIAALCTIVLSWTPAVMPGLLGTSAAAALAATAAAAIALLGPGAFSLDSYLFGRREIVIPHD